MANDSFEECFKLKLPANFSDPSRVCFISTKKLEIINTYEVNIFSRTNDLISKQKVKVTPNNKPGLPFNMVVIQSIDGPYQVSAKRLNGWLSFSYVRDLSTGQVFEESHYTPATGSGGRCGGRRC